MGVKISPGVEVATKLEFDIGMFPVAVKRKNYIASSIRQVHKILILRQNLHPLLFNIALFLSS
jgi:hypothetical protein